jgi:protein SCO1/2
VNPLHVLALVTLNQVALAYPATAASPSRYVPSMAVGDGVPNLALVDQRGRHVTIAQFRGSALALTFAYTRCGDAKMCPLVSAKFAALQRIVAHEPIHLLEVTLDPAYDTPAMLARYGAEFGADPARWTLAGIALRVTPLGIVHTEAVVIVDPAGRVANVIEGNRWSPQDIATEARAARGERAGFGERLRVWLVTGAAAVCGGGAGLSTGAALALFGVILAAVALAVRRFVYPR